MLIIVIHQRLMKKLRVQSERYLTSISDEVQKENKVRKQRKIEVQELDKITEQNQLRCDHIKIEILHIHYSLKEICKFI